MIAESPVRGVAEQRDRCYTELLHSYLDEASEAGLSMAYEWGRTSLERGAAIQEIVEAHHEALRDWCRQRRRLPSEAVPAAGRVLAEVLAPYEMARRGVLDAVHALRRLNDSMEDEARRIARAVHEEAGQLAVVLHLSFAELTSLLPEGGERAIQAVEATLVQVERQLRQLSHELRPSLLDDLGLVAALQWLAKNMSSRHRVPISVDAKFAGRLPPAVETALYRATQEALTNAIRHANPTSISIALAAGDDRVEMSVTDNGCGFDAAGKPRSRGDRGLGLVGMRERLDSVGGRLHVRSKTGEGTVVGMFVPVRALHGPATAAR